MIRKIYSITIKQNWFIIISSFFLMLLESLFRYQFGIGLLSGAVDSFLIVFFIFLAAKYSRFKLISWFAVSYLACGYFIQLSHFVIYKSWLSSIEIYLFFEKFREVVDSSHGLLGYIVLPFLIGLLAFIFGFFVIKSRGRRTIRIFDFLFIIFMVFPVFQSAFSSSQKGNAPNIRHSAVRANYNVIAYFFGKTLPGQLFGIGKSATWMKESPKQKHNGNQIKNIILIMGESQNIDNMSVFGYGRSTTPFLDSIHKSQLIKKTYSGGTYTDVSLPSFFNLLDKPDGTSQIYSWKTNLFNLAQRQGYKTFFYSSQARDKMALTSLIGRQYINDFVDPVSLGYEASKNMDDKQLVKLFNNIDFSSEKKFIVLHQIGSHVPYAERTVKLEKKFGNEKSVDEYDNSVLKTDSIIRSVYGSLKERAKEDWVVIYTSDHGQYVKDNSFGHGSLDNPSHFIVPTVIVSDNKEENNYIKKAFSECDVLFHYQVSGYIAYLMGYDINFRDCSRGYINGSRLDGSAGVKIIN